MTDFDACVCTTAVFGVVFTALGLFVWIDTAVPDGGEEITGDPTPPEVKRYTTEFVQRGTAVAKPDVTIVNTDGRIVVDCPVCLRTKWFWTTCHHGQCPPPRNDDSDVHANPPRVEPLPEAYKEKNRDKHRPRPEEK